MPLFSWLNLLPNKKVDRDTPFIVLSNLSRFTDETIELTKNRDEMCQILTKKFEKTSSFYIPLLEDEIGSAIKFINPDHPGGWTEDALIDALSWINEFTKRPVAPKSSFYFGLQTPTSTRSYNSIMLYRILYDAGIKVDFNVSDYRMAQLVTIMVTQINSARDLIYHHIIEKLEMKDLIKIYNHGLDMLPLTIESKLEIQPPTLYTFSQLEGARKLFSDQRYLLERIQPMNSAEAIALAAKLYTIDISSASDPLDEYYYLKLRQNNFYIPKDAKMKEIVLEAGSNKFNLNVNFNPKLPEGFYMYDHLNDMALSEGYTFEDIEDESAYSLLQLSYHTDTFYHGKEPIIFNSETLGDEIPISQLPREITLCYGTRNNNTMYAFRYQDLDKYFRAVQSLKNPILYPVNGIRLFDSPLFGDRNIRKLKELCSYRYNSDKEEYVAERKSLLTTIIEIEQLNDTNYQKLMEFVNKWKHQPISVRFLIIEAIHKLLSMAMHMRGWSGEDSLPIEGSVKIPENDISLMVTQDIIEFENICGLLGEFGKEFLDLPIYIYEDREYISSHDQEIGRTIKERLEIVKRGEEHESINSCIRMSSGWFMCTAQYIYYSLQGLNLFDIERFRDIS